MKDIHIEAVINRALDGCDQRLLIARAAGVANALKARICAMIAGTLMEEELRRALRLEPDELVTIPKEWFP